MCPPAHVHRCGCAISAQSPVRKLFPFFYSVCVFSTRLLCWTSSVTARRSMDWDCSSKSTVCSGIAAWAPQTETIPHLFVLPCVFSVYTSFQTMWIKLRAIFKIWFYSNSVLLLSYFCYFLIVFKHRIGDCLTCSFQRAMNKRSKTSFLRVVAFLPVNTEGEGCLSWVCHFVCLCIKFHLSFITLSC